MSHGEKVIVIVIIFVIVIVVIIIVMVIVILIILLILIVTKMTRTVIIPIMSSLPKWVTHNSLFSLFMFVCSV